jgi:hypothetical protein
VDIGSWGDSLWVIRVVLVALGHPRAADPPPRHNLARLGGKVLDGEEGGRGRGEGGAGVSSKRSSSQSSLPRAAC